MTDKKFIISITSLLLICAVYLSWAGSKQADLNNKKDWWTLSFADPKNSDPSFVIDNHGNSSSFHYVVLTAGKTKIQENDVQIEKGSSAKIDLSGLDRSGTERILIDVVAGKEKKEIYKNLSK